MSRIWITNVRIYQDNHFQEGSLLMEEGKIKKILMGEEVDISTQENCDSLIDGKGAMLLPGMIDIHTHGAVGVDVNAADVEGLKKVAAFFASQGVTSWNASIVTDCKEKTDHCLAQIEALRKERGYGAQILGAHLEGPFLSKEYKGSMPEFLLREADEDLLRHYQEQAKISYITLAPEVKGVLELIPKIAQEIPVAIGHSGASYEDSMQAIEAGARAITHTFNAMGLFHQHRPAIMGAALESNAYCEAICDGRHLHPAAVRLLLKCKGLDRVVAVTDSIMATGLPDGKYMLGVNEVLVVDGDAKLASNGVRAGSTLTMLQALRKLREFTKRSLEELIPILTENPAQLLGIEGAKGRIFVGADADLILLTEDLMLERTFVGGEEVYRRGQFA